MNERIERELALLRRHYPDLEYHEAAQQWALIPRYTVPLGIWDHDEVAVAFQIPAGYPFTKPYAFYVQPHLNLKGGDAPNNCTVSTEPPFGGEWQKFSWDLPEWHATADLQTGSNLLNFVLTFAERLKEGA